MKLILASYTDLANPKAPKGPELLQLAQAFEKSGEFVQVLCRDVGPNNLDLPKDKVTTPLFLGKKIPQLLQAIQFVIPSYPARPIATRLFDAAASRNLADADILCCTVPSLNKTILAAKKKGMKTILFATSAHLSYLNMLLKDESDRLGIPYRPNTLESENHEAYKNVDIILSRSPFCTRTLIDFGIDKKKIFSEHLYSPVQFDNFTPAKPTSKFRVLFVGNIDCNKGVIYLLRAWDKLKLKNAELVLCGKIESYMNVHIRQYQNDPSVKFLGYTDPKPHLKTANVFCLPSLSEGSPQAAAEAMASAIPIIASENAGTFVQDGKDGFIVPIRSPDAIAEKILYFYKNQKKALSMGTHARKSAAQYAPNKYIKRLIGYIRECAT